MQLTLAQGSDPAGGAALGQVVLATAFATGAVIALLWLIERHRAGHDTILGRLASASERASGLPGWAALPSGIAAVALNVALLGMYWDISLHIDNGRDPGPLANPAHYLILIGLYGVFAAGCIAIGLPRGNSERDRPGPAAVAITRNWHAPVGGILMMACGAFALIGFPLDDFWHRLFGQDVTLWGPTHLMLIGGAGMTLVGQAVLLAEGMRARSRQGARPAPSLVTRLRRIGLMGGLLVGLSTFQAEFDFGVPQFRFVFQPLLIALAASVALVAARVWIGRGGAVGGAVFFLALRGAVGLVVGPILGETTPHLPLYLGEALCVELAGLALGRGRPLALGAVGGLLVGSAGFASEWAWSQVAMPLPWTSDLMPEGLVVAVAAGVAGGVVGGLLGAGLRGSLPRPTVTRPAFAISVLAVAALVGYGLSTTPPDGVRAHVSLTETRDAPHREARATVRIEPARAGNDAAWLTVSAWQGGGFVLDRLERTAPGVYRSTRSIPLYGDWKSLVRLHRGRELAGVPIYLPRDSAIPAPEVRAPDRFTRTFVPDHNLLQREQKSGVPAWLWTVASLIVLALALGFITALAVGLGRVARRDAPPAQQPPPMPALTTRRPARAAA